MVKKQSDIMIEMMDNYEEMQALITDQKMTVKDAEAYLKRYYNFIRRMEDLEASRDKHKHRSALWQKKNKLTEEKLKRISLCSENAKGCHLCLYHHKDGRTMG